MSLKRRELEERELSTELTAAVAKLGAKSLLCPAPELLQAAQAGVLPPDRAKEVAEHLASCELCRSLQVDLEELDNVELDSAGRKRIWRRVQAGMPEATIPVATPGTWRKMWLRPLPAGALALATLAVMVLGVRFFSDRRQPPATVAKNQTPTSLPAASVFNLEKAPIVLPASTAIVWRGQEDRSAKLSKELSQALVPYEKDDYAETARRLERLRKKYPRMAEAAFYLGVSQLFLNQNDDATISLKDAVKLADQPLSDEATWYLALSLYRSGSIDLARQLLDALCRAGRKHSDRACAGVKELQARH